MRRESTILAGCLLALLASGPASADTGNDAIDRGIALYNELEYEKAIVVLEKALAAKRLSREEYGPGYTHLALCYLALGRKQEARKAFAALLARDRNYRLPRTLSREALDLFEDLRRKLPPPVRAARPVQVSHTASPVPARPGSTVQFGILISDPDGRHRKVVVHHRAPGGRGFSTVSARRTGAGKYAATIPGAFVGERGLEYYVSVLDAKGKPLASEGSAASPITLAMASGRDRRAAPVYARWWFWTGVGAVVLGGALAVLATRGDSGSTDATVVITVQPPESQ